MDKMNVAILGSTGIVGQTFIQLLQRNPKFHIEDVYSSGEKAGKAYGDTVNWNMEESVPAEIESMKIKSMEEFMTFRSKYDLVFSALPSEAHAAEEKIAEYLPVITKSSYHRHAKDVPLVIPELNIDHHKIIEYQRKKRNYHGFIASEPNCSSVPIALVLDALRDFSVSDIRVVTMQSISGAGINGVSPMDIMGNLIPNITGEADKIKSEIPKILGRVNELSTEIEQNKMEIWAQCNRIPVLRNHVESLSMKVSGEISLEQIREALEKYKGSPGYTRIRHGNPVFRLSEKPLFPQPRDLIHIIDDMKVLMGQLYLKDGIFSCVCTSSNLIRGAAGNSILHAEILKEEGYIS